MPPRQPDRKAGDGRINAAAWGGESTTAIAAVRQSLAEIGRRGRRVWKLNSVYHRESRMMPRERRPSTLMMTGRSRRI